MAENQAKIVEKRFGFEDDRDDSDYLGVKRMEFKITNLPMASSTEVNKLDKSLKTTQLLVLHKLMIELLPNAKIGIGIHCKQIGKAGALGIVLGNAKGNELFNVEVGFKVDKIPDLKYFTNTLGNISFFLTPFELDFNMMCGMQFNCTFEIVLKVVNPLNGSSNAMSKLFSEVEFTDVKIICDDKTFKCHKSILALQSDVFKAMLYTTQCTENITGIVRVEDISAETMNTLLKYMYQNKITYDEAKDLNLIVAANKYNIVDLVSKCEKIILLTLSMTNIMDVLVVSKLLPTPYLFEKAILFFNQRMVGQKVHQGNRWQELRTQNLALSHEILERCLNMEICTEEEVKSNNNNQEN
jgi:hypothetical protein